MALWPGVIATRGHQLVADGMISETGRSAAARGFDDWLGTVARSQCLYLVAVSAARLPR